MSLKILLEAEWVFLLLTATLNLLTHRWAWEPSYPHAQLWYFRVIQKMALPPPLFLMNVSAKADSGAFLPGKLTHPGALMLFQGHTGDSSFLNKFCIGGVCSCVQQEFEIA